jgi:hypothetical protein
MWAFQMIIGAHVRDGAVRQCQQITLAIVQCQQITLAIVQCQQITLAIAQCQQITLAIVQCRHKWITGVHWISMDLHLHAL